MVMPERVGSLDILVGMYGNGGGAEQIQCLLVLRNLCFHQQSKTFLSTTGEMTSVCFYVCVYMCVCACVCMCVHVWYW